MTDAITSYDPRTGRGLSATTASTPDEVEATVARAQVCASAIAATPPRLRARWLHALADALDGDSARLAALANEETALGRQRLTGELAKAANALRFYGDVIVEGSWLGATIDRTDGAGRPDLRRANAALGPVAVFGASNFPFGFGVLGHDTATALASGCPVVVKAHPAHPRLSMALGELALRALDEADAPAGSFGLVTGMAAGSQLVTHPSTAAVAFTGSPAGGLALWRLAAGREQVIPVFAEMGTVNTAVVTRAAADVRSAAIAHSFVESFTMGAGQFCTKPGLLLVPSGHELPLAIVDELATAKAGSWLLTEAIAAAYADGLAGLISAGARVIARLQPPAGGFAAAAAVLQANADSVTPGSPLLEECFGPVALVVEYSGDEELAAIVSALPGSLAAAVHADGPTDAQLAPLVAHLAERAGRVVVDGWPTGVAVTWAQQHGGPWPATTAPAATSVGAAAIMRFVRPVAYQDVPDSALPSALQDANPWDLPRRIDGVLVDGPLR